MEFFFVYTVAVFFFCWNYIQSVIKASSSKDNVQQFFLVCHTFSDLLQVYLLSLSPLISNSVFADRDIFFVMVLCQVPKYIMYHFCLTDFELAYYVLVSESSIASTIKLILIGNHINNSRSLSKTADSSAFTGIRLFCKTFYENCFV